MGKKWIKNEVTGVEKTALMHASAHLEGNDMEWIGSHAMVSWGKTSGCLNGNCSRRLPSGDGPDGRNGEQPIGTTVQGNFVREVGVFLSLIHI